MKVYECVSVCMSIWAVSSTIRTAVSHAGANSTKNRTEGTCVTINILTELCKTECLSWRFVLAGT